MFGQERGIDRSLKTDDERAKGRDLRWALQDAERPRQMGATVTPEHSEAEVSARSALDQHLAGVRARQAAMTPDQRYDSLINRTYHAGEQIGLNVTHREAFQDTNSHPGKTKEFVEPDESALKARPTPQGRQMGLDEAAPHYEPAFEPTDHVIHQVRLNNPKMNDYDFELSRSNYHDDNSMVKAIPKDAPANRYGNREHVGRLEWHGSEDNYGTSSGGESGSYWCDECEEHHDDEDNYSDYAPEKPREIAWAGVNKEHRGKGLGTALFDIAKNHPQFEGNTPVHSDNRSAAGFGWSKYVGGDEYDRTQGQGHREY